MGNCQKVSTYAFVQVIESHLISEAATDEERIAIYQHMTVLRDAVYKYECQSNNGLS